MKETEKTKENSSVEKKNMKKIKKKTNKEYQVVNF